MVKKLVVSKIMSDEEIASRVGTWFDEKDINQKPQRSSEKLQKNIFGEKKFFRAKKVLVIFEILLLKSFDFRFCEEETSAG